jgi:hypothetical protein
LKHILKISKASEDAKLKSLCCYLYYTDGVGVGVGVLLGEIVIETEIPGELLTLMLGVTLIVGVGLILMLGVGVGLILILGVTLGGLQIEAQLAYPVVLSRLNTGVPPDTPTGCTADEPLE